MRYFHSIILLCLRTLSLALYVYYCACGSENDNHMGAINAKSKKQGSNNTRVRVNYLISMNIVPIATIKETTMFVNNVYYFRFQSRRTIG